MSFDMDRAEFDECVAEGASGIQRIWTAYKHACSERDMKQACVPSFDARPSWDDTWMHVAHTIARRSVDPAFKTGAIIVSADNMHVISVGYNGLERGGSNVVDSLERGASGTVHAEVNALIKVRDHVQGRRVMYVTLSPCRVCARTIVNAGIDEVVYDEKYRDESGIDILVRSGVVVRQHSISARCG